MLVVDMPGKTDVVLDRPYVTAEVRAAVACWLVRTGRGDLVEVLGLQAPGCGVDVGDDRAYRRACPTCPTEG